MSKTINLIVGNEIPPIAIDIRRDDAPLGALPGKYLIEVKVVYPDGIIEVLEQRFNVRFKKPATKLNGGGK